MPINIWSGFVMDGAHREGDIHIHDLDYYPTKTTTCVQYDLEDIFNRGFHTKNGTVRTPQSIQSYATLATIVFQTNQNEQHGGQSIPGFRPFYGAGRLEEFPQASRKRGGLYLSFARNGDMPALKDLFQGRNRFDRYDREQKAALASV